MSNLVELNHLYGGLYAVMYLPVISDNEEYNSSSYIPDEHVADVMCRCESCGNHVKRSQKNILKNLKSCGCMDTISSNETLFEYERRINITIARPIKYDFELQEICCNLHQFTFKETLKRLSYLGLDHFCPRCRIELIQNNTQDMGIEWIGPNIPFNTVQKCNWQCNKGHIFSGTVSTASGGCPVCKHKDKYINGDRVSKIQLALAEKMLVSRESINYRVGNRTVDIAYPDEKIAIEYDGWVWHTEEQDTKKNEYLHKRGWKILRIRSGTLLPDLCDVEFHLQKLRKDSFLEIITLPDWKGNADVTYDEENQCYGGHYRNLTEAYKALKHAQKMQKMAGNLPKKEEMCKDKS